MKETKFNCSVIYPQFESFEWVTSIEPGSASCFIVNTSHFLKFSAYFKSILSEHDLKNISKRKKESDQHQKIIERAILKILLAKMLKQPVHTIEIEKDKNGKPFCTNAILKSIHFSITDSNNYFAITFATTSVGIDIEFIQPHFQYHDIVPLHFHSNEIQALKNAQDPLLLFYRFWTRKESLLKLEGKGITDHLNELDMTEGEKMTKTPYLSIQGTYLISSFLMNDHLMVSISVPSSVNQLRFFNYIANDLE